MESNITLTLIEGRFSEEEAQEMLMNIFLAKIHFHEMKNFSTQERFGRSDEIAERRIPELRKELNRLMQIFSNAKSRQKQLVMTSKIDIIPISH